jgi:sulfur transfer complex TusBCD TusB component (DsrH family)
MNSGNNSVLKYVAILVLPFAVSVSNLDAQDVDRVAVNGFNVRLYLGYVNQANITLFNLKDTVNLEDYTLHAVAEGAEIDYEKGSLSAKFSVLPNKREGYIHFYLEKGGVYHQAKDSIYFKAIKPNPNDDMFKRNMGISKEHPGNKLKSVKHFVLPGNAKVIDSDFELDGYDVDFLERNRMFKIKIRSFVTKVIDGNKYSAHQTRNPGDFEIRSADLKIRNMGKETFYISPGTEKSGGRFEVYLNNKRVSEKSFSILE